MASDKISLQVDSGAIINIERQAAKQSSRIKTVLEQTEQEEYKAIPVSNVKYHVLRKVIEWCEHHKNDGQANINDSNGTNSPSQVTSVDEWDHDFFRGDYSTIFEIILAAEYLEIQALIDTGCLAVAKRIANMPPQDIRAEFNIPKTLMAVPNASASPINPARSEDLPPSGLFNPTPDDRRNACCIIQDIPLQSKGPLPTKLAAEIIALAYSPLHVAHRVEQRAYHANEFWRPGSKASVAALYLSTGPLPQPRLGKAVAQRIVFQTKAADQGWADWGGDGTFNNSNTWFEASILRPALPGLEGHVKGETLHNQLSRTWETPLRARATLKRHGWDFIENTDGSVVWRVSNNITASSAYRNYRVKWERGVETRVEDEREVGKGHGFIERLESGYIVVLWARATLQAWVNRVGAASIEIEYLVQ